MPPKSSVADGVKWFKFATGVFKDQRDREKDDLKCQTPEGMWPDDIKKMRQATTINGIAIPARPMISVPTMDEPVQLVLSGQRKAHLGAKFHPLSEDASDDTAEVLQGLFRNYERDGLAHIARSWAFDRKAKCGTGWWRMLKVYDPEGGHPLDQKLIPKRILYQNAVVPDPFAEEPDWSDGKRLMYVADLALSTFKERYPKSKIGTVYADDQSLVSLGNEAPGWIGGTDEDSRSVRVAEDWLVETEVITHLLLDDNSMAVTGAIPEGRTVKTGRDARSKDKKKTPRLSPDYYLHRYLGRLARARRPIHSVHLRSRPGTPTGGWQADLVRDVFDREAAGATRELRRVRCRRNSGIGAQGPVAGRRGNIRRTRDRVSAIEYSEHPVSAISSRGISWCAD